MTLNDTLRQAIAMVEDENLLGLRDDVKADEEHLEWCKAATIKAHENLQRSRETLAAAIARRTK